MMPNLVPLVSPVAVHPLSEGLVLGSQSVDILVTAIFISAVALSLMTRPESFPGQLAKWLLVMLCIGTTIAASVYRFGSPLAGVTYWLIVRVLATVLLPASAILLVIAWRNGDDRRFVSMEILITLMLGVVCLLTT